VALRAWAAASRAAGEDTAAPFAVFDGVVFFADGTEDVRGACEELRTVRLGAALELGADERGCGAGVKGATAAMLGCSIGRVSWAGAPGRAADPSLVTRAVAAGCETAASFASLAVSAAAGCETAASLAGLAFSAAAGALLESSLASFGGVIELLVCSLVSALSALAATRCALGKAFSD